MQDHWLRVAPPAYILQAHEIGYRGTDPQAESDEVIEDPDQLAAALSQIPGGSIR